MFLRNRKDQHPVAGSMHCPSRSRCRRGQRTFITMPSILIIDDDEGVRTMLKHHFTKRGWDALQAGSGKDGLQLINEYTPDVVLLDLRLPDANGLDILKLIKARDSAPSVVMMTGWGTIENAVLAIKEGAEQYLSKPISLRELDALMDRIMEKQKLLLENLYYQERMDHPVVGRSIEIHEIHHLIDLMGENAHTTVLLTGESGTGKELVAREIHRRSPRRERPFLDVNLAALPEGLIESQLFGHERGAFTDARELKRGLLEVADGGTVFLDEAGEMPVSIQPKLLRVLETHCFKRVGGNRDIQVDVRIIAATNRNLARGVSEGWFREDLYYRLSGFPIDIPPLRERPMDIPVLAGYFVGQFNATLNRNIIGFTEQAMQAMVSYRWPGNARELRNIIERAMVLSSGNMIGEELLPKDMTGREEGGRLARKKGREEGGHHKSLADVERDHIRRILAAENGNRSHAAKVLGISRSTLLDKMKKYGIT